MDEFLDHTYQLLQHEYVLVLREVLASNLPDFENLAACTKLTVGRFHDSGPCRIFRLSWPHPRANVAIWRSHSYFVVFHLFLPFREFEGKGEGLMEVCPKNTVVHASSFPAGSF